MSTFFKNSSNIINPTKKSFIFDLICAAFISLVDLAYPQILSFTYKDFIFLRMLL